MKQQNRRGFLKASGLVAISAMVPSLGCDSNKLVFKEMPQAPDMPDVEVQPDGSVAEMVLPKITPNSRFYLQSIRGKDYDPKVREESWSLTVDGLVDSPLEGLKYQDITSMPMVEQTVTMQCIGNWIGGPLVGNANWGGHALQQSAGSGGGKEHGHPGAL